MFGETWDPTSPRCSTSLSSLGAEQLLWLDTELERAAQLDKHVMLMMHYPPPSVIYNETDTPEHARDLATVVGKYAHIKAIMSGHLHKGIDWESVTGVPTITFPSLRYNPQNYFSLNLYPAGYFEILDSDKNREGARCSDWYTFPYDDYRLYLTIRQLLPLVVLIVFSRHTFLATHTHTHTQVRL